MTERDAIRLIFRVHAIQRMSERSVSVADVRSVVADGETIESYPDDIPFPSRLILGWVGRRPLHVVAAMDTQSDAVVIITVYEPAEEQWDAGRRRRIR